MAPWPLHTARAQRGGLPARALPGDGAEPAGQVDSSVNTANVPGGTTDSSYMEKDQESS